MNKTPEIVDTEGDLPPFWNRNVLFIDNMINIYFGNPGETEVMMEEVGEVDAYGGRLLPILNLLYQGGNNLLALERAPSPELCQYFTDTLGLSLPEWRALTHEEYLEIGTLLETSQPLGLKYEDLRKHPAPWLDGYMTDHILKQLAEATGRRTLSTPRGSRQGNDKVLLHRFIAYSGLPVLKTLEADSQADILPALRVIFRSGFQAAVLRAPLGSSGIGLKKVPDLAAAIDSPPEVPDWMFHDGPCLVQGWLEPGVDSVRGIRSPSVQIFVRDDRVFLYDVTEQILEEGSIHEGNESPPPYLNEVPGLRQELFSQAGVASQWLHEQGYRGAASVDFLVGLTGEGKAPKVFIAEINARVTGATYPSVLARHFLPRAPWLMQNLHFTTPLAGKRILELLEVNGHLYDPSHDVRGVLPLNFHLGSDGGVHKGQFLCLSPSLAEDHILLDYARSDLPVAAVH